MSTHETSSETAPQTNERVTSSARRRPTAGQAFVVIGGALWLALVSAGLVLVARYDNTAGTAAATHGTWPAGSGLVRDPALPTLVMVTHPLCSCTHASLAELAEIVARAPNRMRGYVVLARPGRLAQDDAVSDLSRRVAAIPGIALVHDRGGREASAFGAKTSGQIFVYAPSGELLFDGGTTPSRGHTGDNAGRASILAILNRQSPPRTLTPVFGCDIFGPDDEGPHATGHDAHDH